MKTNIEQVKISPKVQKLLKKINSLFKRESMSEFLENLNNMRETKNATQDIKSQLSMAQSIKAGFRKALRQDPEANKIAKELINDFNNPDNQEPFKPLNKFFSNFALSKCPSEQMANNMLDIVKLAPNEIRSDYYNLIKDIDNIMSKPVNESLSKFFKSIIKK